MKKLLLSLLFIAFLSCTPEQNSIQNAEVQNALSILDGDLLSFKDEASFIKEYTALSEMKTSAEIQKWILTKKHLSLLNSSSDSLEMQNDSISNSRIIYSDAIKAIFNSESKIKIGGKTIWIDGSNFYLLSPNDVNKNSKSLSQTKDKFFVFGQLQSLGSNNSLSNRNVIPNENRIKTFITEENQFDVPGMRLRHIIDLFNETIVFNNQINSSKMYLRSTLQYRSCSAWRCTWKTENSIVRNLSGTQIVANNPTWSTPVFYQSQITGSRTYLFSNWIGSNILANRFQNFQVSGPIQFQVGSRLINVNISWY